MITWYASYTETTGIPLTLLVSELNKPKTSAVINPDQAVRRPGDKVTFTYLCDIHKVQ